MGVIGLGIIPITPPITGSWPFDYFPETVELNGTRTFRKITWAWPFYSGVVEQYRETIDYDAMHLKVYRDGSFVIDHVDEANPSAHPFEHAVLDVPLATTIVCGLAGFGLGLVGGLLLMGQSYGQENPRQRALQLWKFNKVTGLWVPQRTVTQQTADEWLRIFQRDEPEEIFKVSVNKPRTPQAYL